MRIKGFSGLLFEVINQLKIQYQNPANQVNPKPVLFLSTPYIIY